MSGAEMGVTCPQTQGHLGADTCLKEPTLPTPLILDFYPPWPRENEFLLCQAGFRHFVSAAQES